MWFYTKKKIHSFLPCIVPGKPITSTKSDPILQYTTLVTHYKNDETFTGFLTAAEFPSLNLYATLNASTAAFELLPPGPFALDDGFLPPPALFVDGSTLIGRPKKSTAGLSAISISFSAPPLARFRGRSSGRALDKVPSPAAPSPSPGSCSSV